MGYVVLHLTIGIPRIVCPSFYLPLQTIQVGEVFPDFFLFWEVKERNAFFWDILKTDI